MIGLPVFGILMPMQMLMRAITHGSDTNTVRESALKADSVREKNLAESGNRTRVSIAPDFLPRRATS